jgi:hypothetical protein
MIEPIALGLAGIAEGLAFCVLMRLGVTLSKKARSSSGWRRKRFSIAWGLLFGLGGVTMMPIALILGPMIKQLAAAPVLLQALPLLPVATGIATVWFVDRHFRSSRIGTERGRRESDG